MDQKTQIIFTTTSVTKSQPTWPQFNLWVKYPQVYFGLKQKKKYQCTKMFSKKANNLIINLKIVFLILFSTVNLLFFNNFNINF